MGSHPEPWVSANPVKSQNTGQKSWGYSVQVLAPNPPKWQEAEHSPLASPKRKPHTLRDSNWGYLYYSLTSYYLEPKRMPATPQGDEERRRKGRRAGERKEEDSEEATG